MTSKNSVTVLCPNGRRVTVKTTPGSSVLQILEEACQKQNIDPFLYNIKHLRRNLDLSSTVRYSNIPNNAQLELINAAVPRKESLVTVNLATDTGQRLIADFPSNAFLWDLLRTYESQKENSFSIPSPESGLEPVIVYSLRRISGDELKSTTLKSLGLYNGRCMLRYNTQNYSPGGPVQANVSSPLTKPMSSRIEKENKEPNEEFPSNYSAKDTKASESETNFPNMGGNTLVSAQNYNANAVKDSKTLISGTQSSLQTSLSQSEEEDKMDIEEIGENVKATSKIMKTEIQVEESSCNVPGGSLQTSDIIENKSITSSEDNDNAPTIIPLGDRDAILFSLDDAPPAVQSNEEDDFYELSLNEVRNLHRDQMRQLKELEEAPFLTREMRQLERDSRLLAAMYKYPLTQLRICFPDQHVIQASFKPRNTMEEVINFLRPFLIKPDMDFYLYTALPRKVFDPATTLVEAECIPKARLYFGTPNESGTCFLSEDTLKKKSSFEAASKKIVKSRNRDNNNHRWEGGSQILASSSTSSTPAASAELNDSQNAFTTRERSSNDKLQKKPKWFKLGK